MLDIGCALEQHAVDDDDVDDDVEDDGDDDGGGSDLNEP